MAVHVWRAPHQRQAPGCFRGFTTDTCSHHHVHVADKPEEIVPASKPSRAADNVAMESRVATIKQRPTSRCFPSVSDMNVSGCALGDGGQAIWAVAAHALQAVQAGCSSPSPGLGHLRCLCLAAGLSVPVTIPYYLLGTHLTLSHLVSFPRGHCPLDRIALCDTH